MQQPHWQSCSQHECGGSGKQERYVVVLLFWGLVGLANWASALQSVLQSLLCRVAVARCCSRLALFLPMQHALPVLHQHCSACCRA